MLKMHCDKVEPRTEEGVSDVTFSLAEEAIYDVSRHGTITFRMADATGYAEGSDYELAAALVEGPGGATALEAQPAAAADDSDDEDKPHRHRRR